MNGLLGLAAVLVLLACPPQDGERSASLGETATLRVGDSVTVEGESLEVSFDDVLRDSRCPPDVQCIRAGEAVVVLTVTGDGGEGHRLELEVPPGGGAASSYRDHRIRIVSLEPPASATRRIERKDYVLELVVD